MEKEEHISIKDKKQLTKKKLVDQYIINANGGNLG
jgi:hypothetical protein